jgi:nucleotide-binding universal stress UspA family protein
MGKKLLLLTDFSKHSWNAIQYAIRLYAHRQCDFYILNTYKRDSHGFDSITLDPEDTLNKLYENRSKEGLGDILKWIYEIDRYFDHRFYVLSRPGPLLDAVKDIALNQEIDMVFMGARGMNNEQKNKYGKNTLDIIQNIRRCPVMVVPGTVAIGLPKEIILATIFNTDFDFLKIEPLADIARLTKAKIKVLSLADKDLLEHKEKKNKIRLRQYFEGVDYSFHSLQNINMEDALNNFEIGSENMISYIDKKQSLWERFGFGKPTLDKLGYYRNVPVLALHG